ncbi:MAG: RloB family protein [Planctomycetaceae bacterium]|jgi:hypothetical protein|nr:RloB family protein [Planctomycetaceae bacterium]
MVNLEPRQIFKMMSSRKQKFRKQETGIYIIGEGITERYYFAHVKKIFNFRYIIRPRFFDNTNIAAMEKKIDELLRANADIFVICVFDSDVSTHNEHERKKLEQLQQKYQNNENLILCNSLPSIEYWFLLHYENTNRHFNNAKAAETALKRYINNYQKTEHFLENEKWVKDLCAENKLQDAIKRAQKFVPEYGSYSNVHKAFEILCNSNR